MDKYEFNIKVEKMKKAVDRKDYTTAARVADSLNWERSTNAKVLMMIAQIYEKQERYAEARSALTAVYNRVPVGKRIVYKLAELAVKCDDVEEALDLYKEYQEIAPNDPTKLILAYKISTARGDALEKRISILEAYRRRDFEEKWAYELATLYQQAGRGSDCVALCDEIILWFGVGPYVDKAMTLKVAYEPLTPEQEEHRTNKDYYEQKLAEVVAQSTSIIQPTAAPEPDTFSEAVSETQDTAAEGEAAEDSLTSAGDFAPTEYSAEAPSVSPVVKEAALHLTMEQELAQAIQSTSHELTSETKMNEWITDKPLSVDSVGEDIDGQYTLFRTPSEEIGEPHVPEHTRTFSFGALLTKTRRLDSLRDLAELNNSLIEEPEISQTEQEESTAPCEQNNLENNECRHDEYNGDEQAEAIEAEASEESTTVEPTEIAIGTAEDEVAEDTVETAEDEAAENTVESAEDKAAENTVESAANEAAENTVESAEDEAAEDTDKSADDVTTETADESTAEKAVHHMIFCHVLKLEDTAPTVAQIKDAIRQAHEVSGIPSASIARIGVNSLNRAGFYSVLKKLQGRDLLVEHASELTEKVLNRLIAAIEEPPCTAVILLADDAAGVTALYQKAPALFPLSANIEDETPEEEMDDIAFDLEGFMKAETANHENAVGKNSSTEAETSEDFSDRYEADAYSMESLSPAAFANTIYEYTLENDCKFDSMAELALAAHIDRMELQGAVLTNAAAIELADHIIDRADRWTLKCLFVSRYDKEGYLIIKESHIH